MKGYLADDPDVAAQHHLIELIEYTDPYCTWCWGSEPILRKIREVYGDQVKIIFRMGGLVEDVHRLFTVLVSIFIAATGVTAWRLRQEKMMIFRAATLSVILLFVQIILGWVNIYTGLNPMIVTVHLGLAVAIFGLTLITALLAKGLK